MSGKATSSRTVNTIIMTEIHKQYRLTSMEEPTDELLKREECLTASQRHEETNEAKLLLYSSFAFAQL